MSTEVHETGWKQLTFTEHDQFPNPRVQPGGTIRSRKPSNPLSNLADLARPPNPDKDPSTEEAADREKENSPARRGEETSFTAIVFCKSARVTTVVSRRRGGGEEFILAASLPRGPEEVQTHMKN